MSGLPSDAAARNGYPMADGLLYYFPAALAAVAKVSKIGNDQHNPGQPMHWARGKSTDHENKIIRHLADAGTLDSDGTRHSAKVAWRALALLQEELEREEGAPLPRNARLPELPQIVPHEIAAAYLRDRGEQDDPLPLAAREAILDNVFHQLGRAPHPFQDQDALAGHVTAPIGAQSAEVIDVTKGPYVPNFPSNEDGS